MDRDVRVWMLPPSTLFPFLYLSQLCLPFFFCTGVPFKYSYHEIFVLGLQQVVITKVNSHMMLFNFQYILKNNCTLYLHCQISI